MNQLKYFLIITLLFSQQSFGQNKKEEVTQDTNQSTKVSKKDISDDKTKARATLTVSVVNPSYETIGQTIEANGNIEARDIASVTSQVSGLSLSKVLVDVGDTVKKGQVLAEYDDSSVRNDIAQAKASFHQAKISSEQASSNAKRAKKLKRTKAISDIELDNYQYQARLAKARVDAAKAILDNQVLRSSYAKVKAKVNGLVTEKQAILGSIGNPGTPLFSIMVNSELEWQANVPSEQLSNLTPQTPATISLTTNGDKAGTVDTLIIKGAVRKTDPTINSQTRLGKVYVSLEKNTKLKNGLFVRGEFTLGEGKTLTIPVTSIVRKDGYNYVYVVNDNNIVERVKISIGKIKKDKVSIVGGIQPNSKVVSSGVGFLNNGDLVNVVE